MPFNPFKALVAPRPIGWISSLGNSGIANLAPYSFFNAVASMPDMVMFSSSGWKDTVRNIDETGEFVCNYVSQSMLDAMNASSVGAPPEVSEFDLAKIGKEDSKFVAPPRVSGVPAALECRKTDIVELKDAVGKATNHFMVIGEVVGVYIDERFITDGRFDVTAAQPVTRLGYMDYAKTGELFELERPQ